MRPYPRIAIIYGPLRVEERLLFSELEQRGLAFDRIDDRSLDLSFDPSGWDYDVVIARGVSQPEVARYVFLFVGLFVVALAFRFPLPSMYPILSARDGPSPTNGPARNSRATGSSWCWPKS